MSDEIGQSWLRGFIRCHVGLADRPDEVLNTSLESESRLLYIAGIKRSTCCPSRIESALKRK
jgi:hypothetical protein